MLITLSTKMLYLKIPSFFKKRQLLYTVVFVCWASLIAQLVKNLPAMQETPVRFLGWEDLLEKG